MGEVSHLSAIIAQKAAEGSLLWWPDCSLLRWWSRSTIELLLLLLLLLSLLLLLLQLLVLQAIAPILLLLRSAQLSPGWGIHHVVLGRSTTRTTTTRGSSHHPLPIILVGLSSGLHHPLLINSVTHQVIIGQVGGMNQTVL
jgi:hypothetical protein